MTKKSASADLYEAMVKRGLPKVTFDRGALRQMIWKMEGNDAHYPSEDSFIDWAMKHEKIKRVSPGNYEFMEHQKRGSAGLYEALKTEPIFTALFDRQQLRQAIVTAEAVHNTEGGGYDPTSRVYSSDDAFIEWGLKHEKITRVQTGRYRFVQEETAAERDAKLIRPGGGEVTTGERDAALRSDTELDDADLGIGIGIGIATDNDPEHPMMLEEELGLADVHLYSGVTRLPRKMKKGVKAVFEKNPFIRKVTIHNKPIRETDAYDLLNS